MKKLFFLASLTFGLMIISSNSASAQIIDNPCPNPKLDAIQAYYPSIPDCCEEFLVTKISGKMITGDACGVSFTFRITNGFDAFLTEGDTWVNFAVTKVTTPGGSPMLMMDLGY